jgi:tartrate-resistant acid phosphatase type 5
LVFIDTTPLLSEYYQGSDHYVQDQDTAAQRIWLEKTLSDAPSYIKWKLVFGHHPLWTGGGRMKAPETAELKQLLRPIFEKYKVNAYICGHEHSLQHIKPPGFTHYFISAPDLRRRPSLFILMATFRQIREWIYGFYIIVKQIRHRRNQFSRRHSIFNNDLTRLIELM